MIQKLKSNKVLGQRLRTLRLESGKRHITIKELIALKEALNVTYEQIFDNLLSEEE